LAWRRTRHSTWRRPNACGSGKPSTDRPAHYGTAFLQQRLPIEQGASSNTCESYAYAFKLLFEYASDILRVPPSQLHLEQFDAQLIVDFLSYLETARSNGPNSRNTRLAAIKSFMHYMVAGGVAVQVWADVPPAPNIAGKRQGPSAGRWRFWRGSAR
jgi:site-specific recombinase XerC